MTIPQNISQAQRSHPLIYCAEEECGHLLGITRFPKDTPCSWCGGFKRRYQYGMQTSVITNPQFQTTRTFYQRHPGWLAVQLAIIAICAAVGVVGLFAGVLVSVIGLILAAGLGLIALRLPAWKDRVEDRRLT